MAYKIITATADTFEDAVKDLNKNVKDFIANDGAWIPQGGVSVTFGMDYNSNYGEYEGYFCAAQALTITPESIKRHIDSCRRIKLREQARVRG